METSAPSFELFVTSCVGDDETVNQKFATFIGKYYAAEKGMDPATTTARLDRIEPDGQIVYTVNDQVR